MALTIILDRFKSPRLIRAGVWPYPEIWRPFWEPRVCVTGLSPDPPILTLPQPPRLYGWMGSQGMGRKSSMWPHLPMPQQLGGLLTKPSTIPNPRLHCSAIKALLRNTFKFQPKVGSPCNTSHHPPLTISYKLNSQLAISTLQWKLISSFQCKRPQRQCLKGITENLILCLATQNSIKIFLHTVCQKPCARVYTTESQKSFFKISLKNAKDNCHSFKARISKRSQCNLWSWKNLGKIMRHF